MDTPHHNQLPEGWIVVNNMIELDEVWVANVVKGIRKGEINTRELTLAQREEVIAAKIKELKSFFTNQVWEFVGNDDEKGSRPCCHSTVGLDMEEDRQKQASSQGKACFPGIPGP